MSQRPRWGSVSLGVLSVLGICWTPASAMLAQWLPAGSDAENQAIAYSTSEPADAVARLQRDLDAGVRALQFDADRGYLRSVLQALQVPVHSQGLVFSRTSFQRERISPARPRAVYFNRHMYVGWVPGSRVLEIASVDPTLGPVFYTLTQEATAHPRFQRQTQACLQCHDSPSVTEGVPGLIMKSVHVGSDGEPIAASGAHVTSDQTPMSRRWGGWYVTGTSGTQPHMGADLGARVETDLYLGAHSDLVALTVLAHQTHVQNLLTRVGYRTRMALFFDRQRNHELGRSRDHVPEATRRLIEDVAEPLVHAMLFAGEAPLSAPVAGTSTFAAEFADQGPHDRQGRSLYALDLTRRLLRYPCSYLIYSESFDALPAPAREHVYRRLNEVLSGADTSPAFAHLSRMDRTAILEILLDTKPAFAAWRASVFHAT